jgi:hypothetical protein
MIEYYSLPRDRHWLQFDGSEDNPYSIGGRDTDLKQIGYSLESKIKLMYPVNGVPEGVQRALNRATLDLGAAEESIAYLIRTVTEEMLTREAGHLGK